MLNHLLHVLENRTWGKRMVAHTQTDNDLLGSTNKAVATDIDGKYIDRLIGTLETTNSLHRSQKDLITK
jgi:hypothetical protein